MHITKRLFLMTVAFVLLCCMAACDNQETGKDNKKGKTTVPDNAQEFREGLIAHSYEGLTFYLDEKFEDIYDGLIFTNGTAQVRVGYMDLTSSEEALYGGITTAEELACAIQKDESSSSLSTNVRISERHGVHYVWSEGAQEASGCAMVTGCYVDEDSVWTISIEIEDFAEASKEEIDALIDYATLGIIE